MVLNVKAPQLALDRGQVLTLDDAAGTRIQARTGQVWITEEGSVKDHVLGPGEAFVVGQGGRTVVQAMKPAWIALGDRPAASNDAAIPDDLDETDVLELLRRIGGRVY